MNVWMAIRRDWEDDITLGVFASAEAARARCEQELREDTGRRFVRIRWSNHGGSQRMTRPDCAEVASRFNLDCYRVECHEVQAE